MSGYYVENFGCRATQADGAALERQFEQHGLSRALSAEQAELVVINSCTVTSAADQDARAAIRRVRRQNRDAKILVTGCYAQRAPEEVAAIPGVTCVIGNSHKHLLADIALYRNQAMETAPGFVPLTRLIEEKPSGASLFVSDIFAHTELLGAPVFDAAGGLTGNTRTRPNLKVQDGCDNRCSFCVIPYVRGQSRSLPMQQVLEEVTSLVAAGYREVVISGINLGRWGSEWQGSRKPRFQDLIHAILTKTNLEKLRISSVEPMDWSDDLISLVAGSPRIAKHAHVPLQSGSDAVLRRMHRKYRPWHYREKIEKLRAAMPTAAIGADVMVGFPGETDAEFESTWRLIEDLPFTYLHVFTYSARPGTPAASMPNQVPVHVARERNRILRDLGSRKKQTFMQSFVSKSIEAITLGSQEEGTCLREPSEPRYTEALTDNYLKLRLKGRYEPNRWFRAEVCAVSDDSLAGVVTHRPGKPSPGCEQ